MCRPSVFGKGWAPDVFIVPYQHNSLAGYKLVELKRPCPYHAFDSKSITILLESCWRDKPCIVRGHPHKHCRKNIFCSYFNCILIYCHRFCNRRLQRPGCSSFSYKSVQAPCCRFGIEGCSIMKLDISSQMESPG